MSHGSSAEQAGWVHLLSRMAGSKQARPRHAKVWHACEPAKRGAPQGSERDTVPDQGAHCKLVLCSSLQMFDATPMAVTRRLKFVPDHCSCYILFHASLWLACRYLYRPYGRVDRAKLKRRLLQRCNANGEARAAAVYTLDRKGSAALLTGLLACWSLAAWLCALGEGAAGQAPG